MMLRVQSMLVWVVAGALAADRQCVELPVRQPMWFDMAGEIQAGMSTRWRDDDIVISVPSKSGTTWMMNIVHQLRSRDGDEKMEDLYEHVHWLELYDKPTRTKEELYERWAREPHWFPRAFKSHEAPPKLPYDKHVRYVVMMRDPRDALMSMIPFMHAHTDKLLDDWGLEGPMRAMARPKSARDLFDGFFSKGNSSANFLKSWWPLKDEKNVLMLHYADLKRDPESSIRQIHDFLGMSLSDAQLANVKRLTSFGYMQAHGEIFTVPNLLPGGLVPDGMVRKGAVGSYSEEGLADDIRIELEDVLAKQLNPVQAKWLLEGGPH